MELEAHFQQAMERVQLLPEKPDNGTLLRLYGLKKQATIGDVNIESPGMFDFVAQAKYNAWKDLEGTPPAEAMQQYADLVAQLFEEQNPA